MDIKIISHEKNTIHFSIDNLQYILKKKKEYVEFLQVRGVILFENNEPKQSITAQPLGSIIFEFSSDPEKTIKEFFNMVRIYSQKDIEGELLEILKRGICILEIEKSITFIDHRKYGLKLKTNSENKSIVFPRNEDINKILRRKINFLGGRILEQNEICIKAVPLLSNHEKIDMMNQEIFNQKVDKLLKKMMIG